MPRTSYFEGKTIFEELKAMDYAILRDSKDVPEIFYLEYDGQVVKIIKTSDLDEGFVIIQTKDNRRFKAKKENLEYLSYESGAILYG